MTGHRLDDTARCEFRAFAERACRTCVTCERSAHCGCAPHSRQCSAVADATLDMHLTHAPGSLSSHYEPIVNQMCRMRLQRPNVPDMAPGMRLQRARHDARHATATRQGAMLSGQPRVAYCPQYSPHASPACTPQASRPRHRAWSHAPDRITQTSVTAPRPEGGARPTAGGFVGEMARGFVEEMESRGFGGWAR